MRIIQAILRSTFNEFLKWSRNVHAEIPSASELLPRKIALEMFVGNILQRMRCIFGTSDYQKWQVL